ncbi:putative ferric-chelate reductase 1 [Genypterus blacodes]|uniref:putative ferric-chelate reductase 1 n=1 Tax=Genypterus blacodes TaxID=154954 RepID=UPI003F759A29
MDRVLLVVVCLVSAVQCYRSGLVTVSCEDLRPGHSGMSPQTDPPPFTVTAQPGGFAPGQEITVYLQAADSRRFSGFLLQAREKGGRTPVGSFSLSAGDAQLLTCNHKLVSSFTHTCLVWSGLVMVNMVLFVCSVSFVQDFRTFWVDVRSSAVMMNNDSVSGALSPHTAPPPDPQLISSLGCGVTKVCFSYPSNCDPAVSADCLFMSAMTSSRSDAAVHYEVTGLSDGYIAFGFSDDLLMGNDDIYICGVVNGNGLVQLQRAFSTGRLTPQTVPLGNVSNIRTSARERLISCSFTSMNWRSSSSHIMLVHGPSSDGQILIHVETFVSDSEVDISSPQLVSKAGRPHIIKAHGALMLLVWMGSGSVGIMVARYVKVSDGRRCCGKDGWFVVHVVMMSVTVAATVVSFILTFSHVQAWSGGAHPVLGCLLLLLSIMQPTVALLRCAPQHPQRFLFNWSHALIAVAAKALAVAAIFTGLKLIDNTADRWLMKVMGGFVGWEVLFFILFDLHLRFKITKGLKHADFLLMSLFLLGSLTFLVSLLVGIGSKS